MKRVIRRLVGLAAIAGAAWVMMRITAARRPRQATDMRATERRAEPDPEALSAAGTPDRIGFDVGRLRDLEESTYKPVVQYLTAIQINRGETGETLLFVRRRDLEALAEVWGDSPESFLQQFRELGIVLSLN